MVTLSQALDTHTQLYKGPVTRSCAKLLQQEVHAFLSGLRPKIDEDYILPKSCPLRSSKFVLILCSARHNNLWVNAQKV
jgi:hypothetical protein